MLKANIIEVLPERRTDTFDEVSGRWVSEKIYVAEKKKKLKNSDSILRLLSQIKRTIQSASARNEFVGWKKNISLLFNMLDQRSICFVCVCVQSSQILFTGRILIEKEAPK